MTKWKTISVTDRRHPLLKVQFCYVWLQIQAEGQLLNDRF